MFNDIDFRKHGMLRLNDDMKINPSVFDGEALIGDLMKEGGLDVAGVSRTNKGLYFVYYEGVGRPSFLEIGTGGFFKGKDPNVSISELNSRWVDDSDILYIGQTNRTLYERIDEYMKFGQGKAIGHVGGCLIWQIEESRKLRLRWMIWPKDSKIDLKPEQEEKRLLRVFKNEYGKYPFANGRS